MCTAEKSFLRLISSNMLQDRIKNEYSDEKLHVESSEDKIERKPSKMSSRCDGGQVRIRCVLLLLGWTSKLQSEIGVPTCHVAT